MYFNDNGLFGFDVSFYQDNNETPQQINFNKMKSYGASFVVIRGGQNTYPDPDFSYNWKKSKEAGLPRSIYWFLDVHSKEDTQAVVGQVAGVDIAVTVLQTITSNVFSIGWSGTPTNVIIRETGYLQ